MSDPSDPTPEFCLSFSEVSDGFKLFQTPEFAFLKEFVQTVVDPKLWSEKATVFRRRQLLLVPLADTDFCWETSSFYKTHKKSERKHLETIHTICINLLCVYMFFIFFYCDPLLRVDKTYVSFRYKAHFVSQKENNICIYKRWVTLPFNKTHCNVSPIN